MVFSVSLIIFLNSEDIILAKVKMLILISKSTKIIMSDRLNFPLRENLSRYLSPHCYVALLIKDIEALVNIIAGQIFLAILHSQEAYCRSVNKRNDLHGSIVVEVCKSLVILREIYVAICPSKGVLNIYEELI